jgi:outer membrane protein assembly factor BamC
MNLLRLVFLFSTMALISSCSSDGEERPEYLDSYSVKKLEIPPELTRPSGNDELQIPEPSAKALAALKNRESVEGSVSPKFKGIELQSNGSMYWLLIEKDADELWTNLREFLINEGINIYRDEPLLGFIETEWIKEYKSDQDAGFLKKIFSALSADRLDKFRLRLERVEGKKQTRLFISHRGLEIVVVDDGSSWQQTASNQMLEKELLYRMVLFSGLTEEKASDVFAEYKPYQARIRRIGDEESSKYEITGNKDIVWNRVIQAMDRIGADIASKDKAKGALEVLVGEVAEELIEEKDELAESSWLMNVFSGDDEVTKDEKGRMSVFVSLKESKNSTYMLLSLDDNKNIIGGRAEKFREALITLLK